MGPDPPEQAGLPRHRERRAAGLDHRRTVRSGGCLDDPEVHTVQTTGIFPMRADVLPIADWINR